MGFRISGGSYYPRLALAGKIAGRSVVAVKPRASRLKRSPAAAGVLSFVSETYSGYEGTVLQFSATRQSGASGTVAVDWAISAGEGRPNPASGTISWNSAEAGDKAVSVVLGSVSADRSLTITLTNPRTLSGGAAPTIADGAASLQVRKESAGDLAFTPLVNVDFDGLTNGNAIGSSDQNTGVPGKRYDYWGYYRNGYGVRATTAVAYPGRATSCEASIRQGSFGGAGGGAQESDPLADGTFGGQFTSTTAPKAYAGESMWTALRVRFPVGFNFYTNSGFLKFFRASQSGTGHKLDNLILNGVTSNSIGWNMDSEVHHHAGTHTQKVCDRKLVADGQWHQVCFLNKVSDTDVASQIQRIWVDGELSYERLGDRYNKWLQGGVWETEDIVSAGGTAYPLLENPGGYQGGFMLCTYWNGGALQDQFFNIQQVAWHKDEATLTGVDEFGNRFIDMDDMA